jgi:hypothetical protein
MAKRFTDGYFDWVWHYYGQYDTKSVDTMKVYMKSGYKISKVISAYIDFVHEYGFTLDKTTAY